jgi:arsenate reductase-like glutaredoxin family protein
VNVQIFGTQKSQDTKKALRFFKERGLSPQFIDLSARKTAPGELKRFVERFGVRALINTQSRAYERSGLEYRRLDDAALLQYLLGEPALMVQPLVRSGSRLTLGWDDAYWREAVAAERGG